MRPGSNFTNNYSGAPQPIIYTTEKNINLDVLKDSA
jgi:hypothetical protein